MQNHLTESRLAGMWRDLISREDTLVTAAGEPLRVVYPGRLNDDRGADFRDAVIISGDNVRRGSIELHVKSSDWEAHGHHLDPAYNDVILHVVFQEDGHLDARRANGETVDTLSMYRYLEKRLQFANVTLPCYRVAAGVPEKVKEFLENIGMVRFRGKTDQFRNDLAEMDAGQALYRGIMGALGYSKNKIPCLKLAEYIPLSQLESLINRENSSENAILQSQALLLGTAGLLPSQRARVSGNTETYVNILEKYWSVKGRRKVLSPGSWNLFKVRPNNSPLRRLAAITYLIQRYRETGLSASLVELAEDTPVAYPARLVANLLVSTDGYWASHYDFGRACARLSPALLGPDRAGEIIINVIFPFIAALGDSALGSKAREMYRVYPALPPNAIEKHLRYQLGLAPDAVGSASRQQGLIHLYKTRCTQGKCMECPFNKCN